MKSFSFSGKGLIIFYVLIIFPWIYFDLSAPQIDLLRHTGHESYTVLLLFSGFVPFFLIMVFFRINRKISSEKSLGKGFERIIRFIQIVCFVFTLYILTEISMKLPFSNVGFIRLDRNELTNAREIQSESSVNIYIRMSSDEGLRFYFNNEDPSTQKEIETALSERNILFKK